MMRFLVFIVMVLVAFSGCESKKQIYNIAPNTPQSQPCYNAGTNTAQNCDNLDYAKVLESKMWKISAYNYNFSTIPLQNKDHVSYVVRFEKGEAHGSLGCNLFFGVYTIKDGILSFGENVGMTKKLCDAYTMQNESLLSQYFLNAKTKILIVQAVNAMDKIFLLGKDFYIVLDAQ